LGRLLNSGADVNARDRYGQTGLMIAAGRGKADVLRLLIDRGAALDQTAKFGLSAVMLAVINGHVEIVRMLVQAGARLDLRGTGAPGFSGKSAADLAAERGEPAMAEALRGTTST
jgi:ankyrin repeat protein